MNITSLKLVLITGNCWPSTGVGKFILESHCPTEFAPTLKKKKKSCL